MAPKLSCNIRIFKAPPGFLKLFEIVFGLVCLSLFLTTHAPQPQVVAAGGLLFMGNVPFLFTTSLLFISSIISPDAADAIPKTVFELIYNFLGSIFFLISGLSLLILAYEHMEGGLTFEKVVAASVVALINGIFYSLGTKYSLISYRAA